MEEQIRNKFDKESLIKIGKGCLIAGGGAMIIYILEAVIGMDFGSYTPVVVAMAGVLLNSVKEWRKGEK